VRFQVSTHARLLLSLDVRVGRNTLATLGAVREQSPFRTDPVGDGAGAAVQMLVGLARRLGPRTQARLALTENVPRYGDAADIGVSLGIAYKP
jgi:hypothetical protein